MRFAVTFAVRGPETRRRSTKRLASELLLPALLVAFAAGGARAKAAFLYGGEPVHPACVQALAMQQGDRVPVITAVTLAGCSASDRTRSKVHYEDDFATFEDDALLGGGSFGYRELARLDNGIVGLIIRRVDPDGEEKVSMAAVKLVDRPMIRHGEIVHMQQIELLGEIWIPGMDVLSFRSMGNVVEFRAGTGPERVERKVDFTRLGRLRK